MKPENASKLPSICGKTEQAIKAAENEILEHMDAIRAILDRVEPEHGTISIAIDKDYFDLRCIGRDGDPYEDTKSKLNFSLHFNGHNMKSFLVRDYIGFEFPDAEEVDATSIEEYLSKSQQNA